MPILRINANGCGYVQPGAADATAPLHDHIQAHGQGKPVMIMIHGYRYAPSDPKNCPHAHIFQNPAQETAPRPDHLTWPQGLGYGAGTENRTLCIAFGWEAGGTIWRAHREAARAGQALAKLIRTLAASGAGPVHLIAHSLGARVALAALPLLAAGQVDRMILLTGAELRTTAEAALLSPAGRKAQVLNVISRENDLFDFLYEWLLAPHRLGARALGAGLILPHCVTAQIDHPQHLTGLAQLGFAIAAAPRRMCHWSSYTRPGLFDLYRAFFTPEAALDLRKLRDALPLTLQRRWSRLLSAPLPRTPFAVQ